MMRGRVNISHFNYHFYAQEIVSGPGSINRIKDLVEQFRLKNVMLCTTKGFRTRGSVDLIMNLLGDKLSLVYDEVQPHVQSFQVREALNLAFKNNIDGIIAMGGGSAIGIAKALSLALEEKRTGIKAETLIPTDQPLVPVIAIPTTYSGSEMTPVYGITHHEGEIKRKITVKDIKATPKSIIYDSDLTMDLPPKVAAGSGINALAHCIEALYSISKNPVSTMAALSGIKIIKRSLLLACSGNHPSLLAKTEMLQGAFFAGMALSNVEMGLHHGVCHVLGGSAGISHGEANSIMLPYVMLFNLDATAPELAMAAEAMGIKLSNISEMQAGKEAAIFLSEWIRQLNLPYRLRDVGVSESEIPKLANLAFNSKTVLNNPKPIESAEQIEDLLTQAWHGEIYSIN